MPANGRWDLIRGLKVEKKTELMASRKGTEDLERPEGSDHFVDYLVHGRTSTEGISEHVCVCEIVKWIELAQRRNFMQISDK